MFFVQRQTNPEVYGEVKDQNSQNNIKEKNKVGGLMLADIKTNYKANVIKTVWYSQKNRRIDKWMRMQLRNRATQS